MGKRRNFTDQFKAKVTLEALRGDKTIQEIAARHQVHPNRVSHWKRQAVEGVADVFSRGHSPGISEAEVKDLHAKIGRLAVENDFLSQEFKKMSPAKKEDAHPPRPSRPERQPPVQLAEAEPVIALLHAGRDQR